jgi:hypothetical protein
MVLVIHSVISASFVVKTLKNAQVINSYPQVINNAFPFPDKNKIIIPDKNFFSRKFFLFFL